MSTSTDRLIARLSDRIDHLFKTARETTGWSSDYTCEAVNLRVALGKYNGHPHQLDNIIYACEALDDNLQLVA